MGTIEIVRIVVGVFFVLFGLSVYSYDKTHNMKYREFRYSPLSWLGCMLAGIIAGAITVKIATVYVIASVVLWLVVRGKLSQLDKKNNKIKKSV
ncbi:hypothetical protein [Terrisporobacter hibernicus]|uniref:Uncharacterized protein n=1 Tax=Terrisporobacter hibernicus TaxID=2813371 RepID=A0AAX2ZE37_9FIRM|nr:hypothetical protein [Terrisporobacter hibernicus]UEL46339.1 hypothetical protein JW646_11845 [Terrisporobacter hibernicus]